VCSSDLSGRSSLLLEVKGLDAGYDDVPVLRGVSLRVDAGEVVALLGSNAAGKTTLINVISGLIRPTAGDIIFEGEPITHLPPYERVRRGIVQVPEGRHPFPSMTVHENLELGAFSPRARASVAENLSYVYDLLPRLADKKRRLAGSLSGGEQQMLAIGRGLMSRPRLLMLDEPSLGLAPIVVQTVFKLVEDIRRQGTTILLVEQNVVKALGLADRGYVLERGGISLEGKAADLLADEGLRKAHMGI